MLEASRTWVMKSADITAELHEAEPLAGGLTRELFSRRVGPHLPQVFRLCVALSDSHEAAEDLMQSALVRAYVHRESFRGQGSIAGWLCTIARNEHIENVRSTARRRGLVRGAVERFGALFEDWFGEAPAETPERSLGAAQDGETLLSALRSVPDVYRSVVWLCDVEDMTYPEVSAALSIPVGTVKSRHARGRAKLREVLAQGESPREAP